MSHSIGTDEHYITRDVKTYRQKYAECYPHLRLSESSPDAFVKFSKQLEEKDQQIRSLQETVEKMKPLKTFAMLSLLSLSLFGGWNQRSLGCLAGHTSLAPSLRSGSIRFPRQMRHPPPVGTMGHVGLVAFFDIPLYKTLQTIR